MKYQLLTKKDLMERWQLSSGTIDNYLKDGILVPVKGITAVRFNLQHILELEGTKLDRLSPIERKRLERELEEWKTRAEKAEAALRRINITATEAMLCEKEAFQI